MSGLNFPRFNGSPPTRSRPGLFSWPRSAPFQPRRGSPYLRPHHRPPRNSRPPRSPRPRFSIVNESEKSTRAWRRNSNRSTTALFSTGAVLCIFSMNCSVIPVSHATRRFSGSDDGGHEGRRQGTSNRKKRNRARKTLVWTY